MFKKLFRLFQSGGKKEKVSQKPSKPMDIDSKKSIRKGEIGEYKINIQLDQLPKNWKYLSDLLIVNLKSKTGYSQIDHVVVSPHGLFVIETKNYNGHIKGSKADRYWKVNGKFNMFNPLRQNYGHIQALKSVLKDYKTLRYIGMISFTMRCRFDIDPMLRNISSDELVIYDVELSEYIQRKLLRLSMESAQQISEIDINKIVDQLQQANITDPYARIAHNQKAKL